MSERLLGALIAFLLLFSLWPGASSQEIPDSDFTFDRYHESDEIAAELGRISEDYPNITQLLAIGQTYEGRNILALRITDNPLEEEADEPDVLIMGAHHANELPSAEVPMFITEFLVGNYESNSTVSELVDARDIWIVPLVNPDGRDYALNSDPSWRKNRARIDANGDGILEGTGVDLNRNYGHLWGLEGASDIASASNYCGPSAFSEEETGAIKALAEGQNFELSLSYHTYGQLVYYPWGNSIDTLHPREDVLRAIAADMANMTGYTAMEGKDAYYTTGDSDDWLYADCSTLPFTVELGTQYAVPDSEILALCQKNLGAALYAIEVSAEPEEVLLPEWTVMVYMSADADTGLAAEALVDLNGMEVTGSTADMNLIALYDGRGSGDSILYRVGKDPHGYDSDIVSAVLDDSGAVIDPVTRELEMSDPAVMHDFVSWTTENYPAQKYLLSIWGHGDGVLSTFIPDKGAGMEISEISQALEGFELDIVGFDTCSLGHFEVAQELVGIADIMIGSEALEPLAGWDYWTSPQKLAEDPDMEPSELATIIVRDYIDDVTATYITQAAIDLHVFSDSFLPRLNDFVNVSLDFAYSEHKKIWNARNGTDTFVIEQDAVDLYQFLENLEAQNVSEPVMRRVSALREIESGLVIANGTGSSHPYSNAMAVYFPLLDRAVPSEYLGLDFAVHRWDEYLQGTKAPAERPFITSTTAAEVTNTAGPYWVTATVSGNATFTDITVFYRVNGGELHGIDAGTADGLLVSDPRIPGQVNGSVIEYFFLDVTNNITEPYEIKWGGTDYLRIVVNASCDLSVSGIATEPEEAAAGNVTRFSVNCSNAGPEPVTANITLTAIGEDGTELIGWELVHLGAGQYAVVVFNWTAEAGNWNMTASATQTAVFDRDPGNQNMSVWVNVTGPGMTGSDFLIKNWTWLLGLVLIWTFASLIISYKLRELRRNRSAAARRSIAAAREFLRTAEEFGGDISEANGLLLRAELACSQGEYQKCGRIVKMARESAMNAVGSKGGVSETSK